MHRRGLPAPRAAMRSSSANPSISPRSWASSSPFHA
jgi:hypothetical protein